MPKKFDLFHLITQVLLAFLIGLSGAGCLCTAFSLDVAPGNILLACALWAVVIPVALQLPRGGWIAAGTCLMGLLFAWWQDYAQDLKLLLRILFSFYRQAYGWQLPEFLRDVSGTDVTFAVAALAAVCTVAAALCLHLRGTVVAVLAAAFPLIPCLVVTDTVPSAGWLFATLVLVALLLITGSVRRQDARQASRLTALLLVPVLLCSWLLFALNPQATYDKASDEEDFGMRVLELLDKIPLVETDEQGNIWLDVDLPLPTIDPGPITGGGNDVTLPQDLTLPAFTLGPELLDAIQEQVSLKNAGPRNPIDSRVLSVTTTYRGTLYLRERGYDLYTGIAWGRTDAEQVLEVSAKYLDHGTLVSIHTVRIQSHFFVPYYTYVYPEALPKGYKENPNRLPTYNFQFYPLLEDWQTLWQSQEATPISQITEYSQYLQLTDYARVRAQELLEQIGVGPQTDVVTAANTIAAYVKNSARYDLSTPAMPDGEKDFAIWFLTESETGYCVHFASAAAVLLRAAGIPARYVEGYMATVCSSETKVSAEMAHAWVEYYVPGVGWLVLEATPGGETPDVPVPTVPPTTAPTEPATTVPTQPPTTAPTEPTVPSTTLPTLPTVPTTVPTVPSTAAPTTLPAPTTVPTQPGASTAAPSAPPQTTQPSGPTPQAERPGLWATLSAVLFLLSALCALLGQWQLRLWLNQFLRRQGDANRQAITLWQQCRLLARLRRQQAPVILRDLAWKAKYSQHTISESELQEFYSYMDRSLAHLQKRPWYLRLIYRLIFAAY